MQLLSDDVEELPPVGYIEGVESLETDWRKFLARQKGETA